ncbi:hypothetical protein PN419_17320 [Halorubrum ezzemoulense]|uniref:hypothetical protein n=1 Tax=Halorubrum ezzemoulense TaxID=337243 RepID=UPI00232D483F|nr:hypothetical protein [Halorubrum ezzemoulense]MDB9250737.1 hypothetical protein [Halorubrum ezzemoulense]MDB9253841.1 hypothetical protein [Halorubrum ezzemoulense]MDB9257387.1 hypothetical protein [Halorubrum ezzemoulense]MDB9260852.1 hypothetical protein [Halorubrum ezzemoulense]MDB9264280.1 hypothetical protein [Halorubrum ezzemoulense]
MDVVVILGVAGALIGVHVWLPNRLLSEFVFTYGEPSLVTAWTAATIHDSTIHLTSNLVWYGVVIGPAYTLYAIRGRRRLFWLLYTSLFVATPLSTIAVDYWLLYQRWGLVGPDSIAFGFSGVVSAFGGLLLVGLIGVIAAWYSWSISIAITVGFVASGLGISLAQSLLVAVPTSEMLTVGIVVAVGPDSFWWWSRERSVRRWLSAHQDAILLFGACGVAITALVVGMFSVAPVSGGRFPNVVAHGNRFVTGISLAATGLSLL